jgi:hypothetical protein
LNFFSGELLPMRYCSIASTHSSTSSSHDRQPIGEYSLLIQKPATLPRPAPVASARQLPRRACRSCVLLDRRAQCRQMYTAVSGRGVPAGRLQPLDPVVLVLAPHQDLGSPQCGHGTKYLRRSLAR